MRDRIYLSAMLHDVGEFVKMSNIDKMNLSHSNVSYNIAKELHFLKNDISYMENLIINHHNPKTTYEKIITAADILSCKEEQYEEKLDEVMEPQLLRPIFSKIKEDENGIEDEYVYDIKSLDFKNIFPSVKQTSKQTYQLISKDYEKLYNEFYTELKKVKSDTQLLFLLEKYLWCIPTHDIDKNYDVSMYEHAKNASAIALCLYDQYKAGEITEEVLDNIQEDSSKQFILINGDISGIQDFLMKVSSKGAAKSLKSHSVYLSILTDVVVKYIIDNLNLKDANLLYSGGGSFFILAPKITEYNMNKIKKEIMLKLLKSHDGELFFAIDYIDLSPKDFINFPNKWQNIVEKVNKQKYLKWNEIDTDNKYELIFGPFDEGTKEGNHCSLCGISYKYRGKKSIVVEDYELDICSLCNSYIVLTNKLRNANYLSIRKCNIVEVEKPDSYNEIFRSFGYNIDFHQKIILDGRQYYLLNDTNFLDKNCEGFKFGTYYLPKEGDKWLTFEELASKSKGDKNLIGILKLDVDNLGSIFGFGLKDNKTVSRITTFSRMMSLYFEGYINGLIKDMGMEKSIYVVYSGGDDTFLIGAWDKVLVFADKFRTKFSEYVCHNEKITFTAGIGIFDRRYPVIRSIEITESSLSRAKDFRYKDEELAKKNKVSLLGEVFNWEEFNKIEKVRELLVETIEKAEERNQQNIGRSLLYKIYKSTLGFRKILDDSNTGKVDTLRFWNLAYYLREVKQMDDKYGSKFAEDIIQEYREIVLHNLMEKNKNNNIRNIMIIPVATKLAEMSTKDTKEG